MHYMENKKRIHHASGPQAPQNMLYLHLQHVHLHQQAKDKYGVRLLSTGKGHFGHLSLKMRI